MSEMLRGPLLRRAAREQRTWLLTIGALLVLNLVLYLAMIRPLSHRVSSVSDRTQTAEFELAGARLAQTRAAAALTGKSEAATKLDSFYHQVLPPDFPAARRLFFPWINQVARDVGLQAESSSVEVETDRERQLTKFSIQMQLTGSYASIREFIHRLERASRFVVIDRVTLQEDQVEGGLSLKLALSTFYKGSAQ